MENDSAEWSVDQQRSKGERIKKFPETNENNNSLPDSLCHKNNTKKLCS
jgi:hypothetical protein